MCDYVNSQQIQFNRSRISCGVLEAHHLPDHTGSKLCFSVATALYHKANPRPSCFITFSDVVDSEGGRSRGERLVAYLRDNHLFGGTLLTTSKQINPRTGNTIQMWIYEVNHPEFRKFYQAELANRIEDN